MKQILLMRHGSAQEADWNQKDHQRPLTESGKSEVSKAAQVLWDYGWKESKIVSSSAVRAQETAEICAQQWQQRVDLVLEALYMGGWPEISSFLLRLDSQVERLTLFGHNPGWSEAATELSRQSIALQPSESVLLQHPGPSWQDAVADVGAWTLVKEFRRR